MTGDTRSKLGELARMTRARDWAHFLVLPAAGAGGATPLATALALARGVLIALAILAFGYLVNGASDRHMDSDPSKNALVAGRVPARRTGLVLFVLAASALLVSFTGPASVTLATLVSLCAGTVYSFWPRIKRFPVIGTLANAACFAPLLWLGVVDARYDAALVSITALFALLLLQNQLLHEAADREDDARGRVRTTVITLGARGASVVAMALGAGTLCWLPRVALAGPMLVVFAVLFPLALFLWGEDPARMRRVRLAHRAACIVAGAVVFSLARFAAP